MLLIMTWCTQPWKILLRGRQSRYPPTTSWPILGRFQFGALPALCAGIPRHRWDRLLSVVQAPCNSVLWVFFSWQAGGDDYGLSCWRRSLWGDPGVLQPRHSGHVPSPALCGHRFWRQAVPQRYGTAVRGSISLLLLVFLIPPHACGKTHVFLFYFPVLVLRDMKRGRDLEQILTQYTTFVKPAFEEFCLPVLNVLLTWFIISGERRNGVAWGLAEP